MSKVREEAQASLKQAAESIKRFYDWSRGDAWEYKIGDKVWLEGTNITTTRPSKKLDNKRYGPFSIEKKEGQSAYRLRLPATWRRVHPVFHEALLTPYRAPTYPSQRLPTPALPVIVEGDEEYEVDEILNSRMRAGKLQYLVKWKDYPNCTDWTWEPESNITHAPEAVKDFHLKHPNAPRRTTATLRFHSILKDNIPVHIPRRLRSPTGQIFNWGDGVFERYSSNRDDCPKERVMSWTLYFHLFSNYPFTRYMSLDWQRDPRRLVQLHKSINPSFVPTAHEARHLVDDHSHRWPISRPTLVGSLWSPENSHYFSASDLHLAPSRSPPASDPLSDSLLDTYI